MYNAFPFHFPALWIGINDFNENFHNIASANTKYFFFQIFYQIVVMKLKKNYINSKVIDFFYSKFLKVGI